MDKRIEKTKKALHTAFYQLRAGNAIRDIKIADLCKAAEVNKTTFYSHYRSIYDLSAEVEKQLIQRIITSIPRDRDYTFENPASYTKEVTLALERNANELAVLFSDSERSLLSVYLDQVIKEAIFAEYPDAKHNAEMNVLLSYCIYGAFGARMSNPHVPLERRMAVLEAITQSLQPLMGRKD